MRPSGSNAAQRAEPQVFDVTAAQPAWTQKFESMIAVVESHVLALGAAMRRHEPLQVAVCAQALQAALVDAQTWARRTGSLQHGMPPALHQRLAIAAARATACREAIARTLAAQGRELQVLLPAAAAAMAAGSAAGTAVYNAQGQRQVAASALGALA